MPVNYIDIIISVILLFFLYRGVINGFLREVSALVGVIGGIFLAKTYAAHLSQHLVAYTSASASYLIAFILIIILSMLVASLIARIISSFLKVLFASWIDHLLGALFGIAKGILIVTTLIYATFYVFPNDAPLLQNSIFLPYYNTIIEFATTALLS